jgi:hypothetical protein
MGQRLLSIPEAMELAMSSLVRLTDLYTASALDDGTVQRPCESVISIVGCVLKRLRQVRALYGAANVSGRLKKSIEAANNRVKAPPTPPALQAAADPTAKGSRSVSFTIPSLDSAGSTRSTEPPAQPSASGGGNKRRASSSSARSAAKKRVDADETTDAASLEISLESLEEPQSEDDEDGLSAPREMPPPEWWDALSIPLEAAVYLAIAHARTGQIDAATSHFSVLLRQVLKPLSLSLSSRALAPQD